MLFRPDRRRYLHQLRDGNIQFSRHDFLDDARRKRRKPQNPAEIDRAQAERVRKRLLVGVGARREQLRPSAAVSQRLDRGAGGVCLPLFVSADDWNASAIASVAPLRGEPVITTIFLLICYLLSDFLALLQF